MTPAKAPATATEVHAILREVCESFIGQPVVCLGGGRRLHRQRIAGTVIGTTSSGMLVAQAHGRTLIAYADLYARHVEILDPSELVEAIAEGLARISRASIRRTLDQALADAVLDMASRGTVLVGVEMDQQAG